MLSGYKSETGAVWLAAATAAVLPFVPRKALLVVVPVWAALSRFVARGAYNHARPVNVDSPEAAKKNARFVMSASMRLADRPVAVVTGTNSGIGFYTAVEMAAEGYVTIITCRSAVLTQQTAERIATEAKKRRQNCPKRYHNAPEQVKVVAGAPIECDDYESVRAFAKWFSAGFDNCNFQVLVNNAGGMRSDFTFSKFNPKLEYHTAVNFLGPMLLTELLLPALEKNGGRVVYVSSEAHRFPQAVLQPGLFSAWLSKCQNGLVAGRLLEAEKQMNQGAKATCGPLTSPNLGKSFARYGTSKLLNTYHAHVIAQRYRNCKDPQKRVYACSLHPGCVATNFSRDLLRTNFLNYLYQTAGLLFLKSCEDGAQTTLHCAMCPLEELELVLPKKDGKGSPSWDDAVSPYFVECANKTYSMLLAFGWDLNEAESIVAWGKTLVGL